jgi:hypothetical protein
LREFVCNFQGEDMYAIEFRTRIKDGFIEIPQKFRNKLIE